MNVVTELKKERERLETQVSRLDQAIMLLGDHVQVKTKKAGHRWSAAARARAAARMRAAWKSGKIKGNSK